MEIKASRGCVCHLGSKMPEKRLLKEVWKHGHIWAPMGGEQGTRDQRPKTIFKAVCNLEKEERYKGQA